MPTIVPLIIQFLPSAVTGVEHLIAYLANVRKAAAQSGEWTAEYEAAFLAAVAKHNVDPAYIPHRD